MPTWELWLFFFAAIAILAPFILVAMMLVLDALVYIAIGIGLAGKWLMNKVWRMEE